MPALVVVAVVVGVGGWVGGGGGFGLIIYFYIVTSLSHVVSSSCEVWCLLVLAGVVGGFV